MGAPLEKTSVPGVYRRGGRYTVTYRDPSGKQRSRSAATMAEARSLKAEVSADLRRGEYRETSRLTFADYAADWMRGYSGRTSRGLKATTLADYVSLLEHHVLPVLGRRRLRRWSPGTSRCLPRPGQRPLGEHGAQHHRPRSSLVRDGRRGGRYPGESVRGSAAARWCPA